MTASAKHVLLIEAPYDSGHRGARMGAGSLQLAPGGATHLRTRGYVVEHRQVALDGWQAELLTGFQLQRAVASYTSDRGDAQFPLLLAGNCNTSLGMLAGSAEPGHRQGLIWLDAHGDFNTPDTDTSGFLDGQGLAMAVGRCWRAALEQVPGFQPVPEDRVLLIGARDLDDAEEHALTASDIGLLSPEATRDTGRLEAALEQIAERVDAAHLHIDLDVHDPSSGTANGYSAPHGLSAVEVREIVKKISSQVPVASASLASYDPAHDRDGRMRDVALELIEVLADLGTRTATAHSLGRAAQQSHD